MQKRLKIVFISAALCLIACKKDNDGETILKGTANVLVDETLFPIIEDQVEVFESDYEAKIHLMPKSETEAVQALFKDSAQIIILSRNLTDEEQKVFASRKIYPESSKIGTDAIALIANISHNDTVIDLEDVVSFMKGDRSSHTIKGLVFDNPNSSTMRVIKEIADVDSAPQEDIYSFRTNEGVIKFISENSGMIGIVGLNWLTQPSPASSEMLQKIKILSVKDTDGDTYYYPSQNNLAEGTYPLARDLYIVNAQSFSGLGVGFSTFIAGDRGQRIILKSGLLPVRIPSRQIMTRKQLETKNNN